MKRKFVGKYKKGQFPYFVEGPHKDIEEMDIYLILDDFYDDSIVVGSLYSSDNEFILYIGKNVLIKMRNQKINEILK